MRKRMYEDMRRGRQVVKAGIRVRFEDRGFGEDIGHWTVSEAAGGG